MLTFETERGLVVRAAAALDASSTDPRGAARPSTSLETAP
jgi:hypothetical protein